MFISISHRYGKLVAKNPWKFILVSLALTGLSCIGLLNYYEENNAFKLWIPSGSDFVKNNEWLQENFPPDIRFNNFLIADENVLTTEMLQKVS